MGAALSLAMACWLVVSAFAGALAMGALAGEARAATLSSGDLQTYRAAFAAADRGDFTEAARVARRAREDLPAKAIRWLELSRPETTADWATLTGFLEANPDWPNLAAIRRNAETRMPDMPPARVKAWFDANPPLTLAGFDRYIAALLALGDGETAIRLVRTRYVQGAFGRVEERDFRRRHNSLLRPADIWARIDRLLWDGDGQEARRLLPLVDKGRQALALARIALAEMDGGVDSAIRRVPAALQDDPGLTFERLRWRRKKDLDARALELLKPAPKELGRAELWWTERHILARRLMESRDYARAYAIVAPHGTTEGLAFAQAEFLAGFLALRFLDKPEQALAHFERLHGGVASPISLARGAYWAGRANAALGRKAAAAEWFARAVGHGSTFYGLLAAGELEQRPEAAIPGAAAVTADLKTAFDKREPVRLVRQLARIRGADDRLVELFLRSLTNAARTAPDYEMVGNLALEIGRRDLGVTVARQALQDGIVVLEAGYPKLDKRVPDRPEPALIHALIRQESTFDTNAVSVAGARGLMQLMPATAQQVARELQLRHAHEKLTADPAYNIRLGSYFLQDLIDRFGGSYVMAIAAYNAGPGRVTTWVRQNGDPRSGSVDVIDWIELIPIYETRNYVQRVMENLQIYRVRLETGTIPLEQDLRRGARGTG